MSLLPLNYFSEVRPINLRGGASLNNSPPSRINPAFIINRDWSLPDGIKSRSIQSPPPNKSPSSQKGSPPSTDKEEEEEEEEVNVYEILRSIPDKSILPTQEELESTLNNTSVELAPCFLKATKNYNSTPPCSSVKIPSKNDPISWEKFRFIEPDLSKFYPPSSNYYPQT